MKLLFLLIACEGILAGKSEGWPQGTYGLPKPVSGCPPGWQEGWRKQDLEDTNPRSNFSTDLQLHMDATLTGDDIKRSFCVKTTTLVGETISWPAGSYCVYKKNQCPSGMKSGFIKWDDEDRLTVNMHAGILPDGTFDSNTKIFYCCQDQGRWSESIELPVDRPFYLLPHNSSNCQRVKGAVSTLEYITYDTENFANIDKLNGSHVFARENEYGLTIYYCYYVGCIHKLQNESGRISATHFPDNQYCSWSISVNQGFVVSITFTSINIRNCDENIMDIRDGLDDTAALLMRICGDNATSGLKLRSTGNTIFITLKSGDNLGWDIQFHADYNATTPFSGMSWPSGTYSLPKTTSSCPEMWIPGWRKQIMEDDNGKRESSAFSADFHMDASLVDYSLTRHFCTKTFDSEATQKDWPAGKYCIYKKNQCPLGMKEGSILWDDEDEPNNDKNDKHGTLPDGEYGESYHFATKIFCCCHDQGKWNNAIELPINEPFYLLPHQSDNCQRVNWALSTLESVTYDTEDRNNYDKLSKSHVYAKGGAHLPFVIYYCYYQGCQHQINAEIPSHFSLSSSSTHDFQYCSWLLSVRYGRVTLTFSSMSVPDCTRENFIEVRDGPNETSPVLAKYCGSTTNDSIASTGRHLFVLVKSGSDVRMGTTVEFNATYKCIIPTTPSTTSPKTSALPSSPTPQTTTSPINVSTRKAEVNTRTDVVTSDTKGRARSFTTGEGKPIIPTDAENHTSYLAIVIAVCATVLIAVLILSFAILYRKRPGRDSLTSRTTDETMRLSNPQYNARYQPQHGVSILPENRGQGETPCDEKNDALYEPYDNTYTTIDDAKDQYNKELAFLATNPPQTSMHQTSVQQDASTSSSDRVYAECAENTNPYQNVGEIFMPYVASRKQSHDNERTYEKPMQSPPGKPYDKASVRYAASRNPYQPELSENDAAYENVKSCQFTPTNTHEEHD